MKTDWTCLAFCPQCHAHVISRGGFLAEHEYKRIRCPGSSKKETYSEDAKASWGARGVLW